MKAKLVQAASTGSFQYELASGRGMVLMLVGDNLRGFAKGDVFARDMESVKVEEST